MVVNMYDIVNVFSRSLNSTFHELRTLGFCLPPQPIQALQQVILTSRHVSRSLAAPAGSGVGNSKQGAFPAFASLLVFHTIQPTRESASFTKWH